METINDRIASCIEKLGIKKTNFADRLNISQAFVSQLTKGTSLPSDRTIADICREFNVNEHWLRTGEGEMFIPVSQDEEFIQIMTDTETSNDDRIKKLISAYWKLPDEKKAVIWELIDSLK